MAGEKRVRKSYSFETKVSAVKMYLEGGKSLKETTQEIGITDTRTLRKWIKNYQEYGADGLKEKRGKSKHPRKGRPPKQEQSLEARLKRAEAERDFYKTFYELTQEDKKKRNSGL